MVEHNGVAIFGGSFNPIHNGHLLAAEKIRQDLRLKKVIFVPAAKSPHKTGDDTAPAFQRLVMTALAINGNPAFELSDIEVERGGKSYSYDTVRELEKIYGSGFVFIIGSDTVLEFSSWKEAQRLVEECRIVVVGRPGYEFQKYFSNRLVTDEVGSAAGMLLDKMELIEIKGLDVSSTELRDMIRQGKSIKYLVPEQVETYIAKRGLYNL